MIKLKELISNQKINTIFLDQDGVLCDFNKQFKKFLANDVLFKSVITRKKAISNKKLEQLGLSKNQFYQKANQIRAEVLNSGHEDIYEIFKDRTRNELLVSLSWPIVGMGNEIFWSSMDWMPGGKELVQFVKSTGIHTEILTAGSSSNLDATSAGKQQWLKNNGLGNLTFNIVQKGSDKYEYADPSFLLIDDKKENIELFIKSGGMGIVHVSTPQTIKQFQQLQGNKQ